MTDHTQKATIGALAALIALIGLVGIGAVAPAAAAPADNVTVTSNDAVATDATPSWIAGDEGDVAVDLGDSSLSAANVTLQSAELTVSDEFPAEIVGTQINASDIGSGDAGDTATIDILVDGDVHETVTIEVIDPSVTTAEVAVSELNGSSVTVAVDTDELPASGVYSTRGGRNSSEIGVGIGLVHDGEQINGDRISTTDDQGIANLSAGDRLTDPASLPPDGNVTISTTDAVTEITVGGETVYREQATPITGVTGDDSPLSSLSDTQLLAVAAAVAIGVLAVAGRAD
ncbi:hypothetical protein [Halorubrum ezzemoulense]|nr:hypothetical protein [Halorubrum ezzemoulense]